MSGQGPWGELAGYARWAPSPHNTQPARLKILDQSHADVVFLPQRGLYVADPEGDFTLLTFGIFVEIIKIAAAGLGYRLAFDYPDAPLYAGGDHSTPQVVAHLRLERDEHVSDLDPALILERRTSRLPYDKRPLDDGVVDELREEAAARGHTFEVRRDPETISWIIDLNKRSLFYDLEDEGIRTELQKWLRFDKAEARSLRDGLSAECLRVPGPMLRSFMRHHRAWSLPLIRQTAEFVYGRTMRGISTVAWLQGPFRSRRDKIASGHLMIRMWLRLTKHGAYLHPYGSIITNPRSRALMLERLGLPDEEGGRRMVWLIMRMGYSGPPPRSERLDLDELIEQ